jgi:hypothetical protein
MSSPTQSDPTTTGEAGGNAASFEPWVKVALAGFVPLVLAFYLPIVLQPYLLVTGTAIVLWSIVMLVRQELRKSADARP